MASIKAHPKRLKKTVPRWLVDDVFPTDFSGVKLFSIYLWLWGFPNNIYIYIPVRYSHNIKIIYRINITWTNPIISHFIILYHIKLYGYYPIIIPYIYNHIYIYTYIYIYSYIPFIMSWPTASTDRSLLGRPCRWCWDAGCSTRRAPNAGCCKGGPRLTPSCEWSLAKDGWDGGEGFMVINSG